MSEIMKITDLRERGKNKDKKKQRGDASYSESMRAKWFCFAFKPGFIQWMCKASLIFTSHLQLALSIILKERELIELYECYMKIFQEFYIAFMQDWFD